MQYSRLDSIRLSQILLLLEFSWPTAANLHSSSRLCYVAYVWGSKANNRLNFASIPNLNKTSSWYSFNWRRRADCGRTQDGTNPGSIQLTPAPSALVASSIPTRPGKTREQVRGLPHSFVSLSVSVYSGIDPGHHSTSLPQLPVHNASSSREVVHRFALQ